MTNFASTLTDVAALAELGSGAERARLDRNLSQQQLSDLAGVSKRTLERFEAGESTTTVNLLRILRALGLLPNLDLVFPQPAASPLAQLRLARSERRRASPRRPSTGSRSPARRMSGPSSPAPQRPPEPFRWGDETAPGAPRPFIRGDEPTSE